MRVLYLLLLACACSAPTTYNQSAMPVAPAFNPVTRAPTTTGQPGYVGEPEAVPRSPHRRVLPPTREPTMFSGDQPHAADSDEAWPDILGLRLPLPPVSRDLVREVATLQMCASSAAGAITASRAAIDIAKLSKTEVRCLAARLHLHC